MFDWLRKIINWLREPISNEKIVFANPAGPEPPTPQPHLIEKQPSVWNDLDKIREEQIRREFLPTPKTTRISHPHAHQPPAEQHRDAISKFMKGKASSRYLRTIKQSPKIKINDEADD
jgi:hypothetical protein